MPKLLIVLTRDSIETPNSTILKGLVEYCTSKDWETKWLTIDPNTTIVQAEIKIDALHPQQRLTK